jgi:hypothetical protein
MTRLSSQKHLLLLSLLLGLALSACRHYDKKDFEFSKEELAHFSQYHKGDTLIFQSDLGKVNTLLIEGFDTERHEATWGFMAPQPGNSVSIGIRHLPVDTWHGTAQVVGQKPTVVPQSLFRISKRPYQHKTTYMIELQDFFSSGDGMGEFHADSLTLDQMTFNNYYVLTHEYPDRPSNIVRVYWTDRYGLTAYQSKGGETWTLRKHITRK